MKKIAVAIVHGIGLPDPHFADGMMGILQRALQAETGTDGLVMKPVYWAPVIQEDENELWRRMKSGGPMDFVKLRRFMVDFAADAIAYQPIPGNQDLYEAVHRIFAQTLRALAEEAGPKAPLAVISHSLGTVIASNYLYDLQTDPRRRIIPKSVRAEMTKSPLERGETLARLFTMGSPLPLWSLRYKDFGKPVQVPSPRLSRHLKNAAGEWINFYDQDDIIGYPLKTINDAYHRAVREDKAVNVGGLLSSWNPAAHTEYWKDGDVTGPIARSLVALWKALPQ